jgi:tryptophan synthase
LRFVIFHLLQCIIFITDRICILQLGVPFSDPLADGGTIQKANQIALENGVTLRDCITFVHEARSKGLTIPVLFMGYLNPFLQYGYDNLAIDCADAGVDGFIIVDLPPEDCGDFLAVLDKHGLGFVPLVTPTTPSKRFEHIVKYARGFVYLVSVTGVTGARAELPVDLSQFVLRVKETVQLPVAVGFGVSTRDHVLAIGKVSDGVVVGSAIINKLNNEGIDGMKSFIRLLI